ncbi:DUF2000 domain-containing protein [Chryseobacterium rhizosphaerae]|uniref:DUF2000 domain-containing protein n=1 Tax=Chryseobacterium rhizosphaerae TaxID=395937 RepID=A0ABX9IKB8_9FLAO|nr:DUF2000 domain-containing protein [Chryseobacterium rhizosphaerae]REC74734.1 DUF2000 domain-containing protein [Chryseobacterium rhizosphaerae]GEN66219.1 hypothetical protein CRH01_07870 [Chryseobacterium rhizosphaerae]
MYDKKVAIVIKDDLLAWQKLNVVSFLAGSIAIQFPETHGQDFITADQEKFLPFIKHPTLIYKADTAEKLQRAFRRSRDRELAIGIYTRPLFDTHSGEENVAEIAKHTADTLDLVGIIVYGDHKKVDKALDGLKFHE